MMGYVRSVVRRLKIRLLLGSPLVKRLSRMLPQRLRRSLASSLGMSSIHRYQDFRSPETKAMLVSRYLDRLDGGPVRSVLDVGCNAGEVSGRLTNQGFFVLGIDRREIVSRLRPGNARRSVVAFDVDAGSIPYLPQFDCVLLLSVHHQWVAEQGDSVARKLVSLLSEKAEKTLVVEFACLNSKYGQPQAALFDDNDHEPVREYARGWLGETLPDFGFEFLGLNEEHPIDEPFRVLFGGHRTQGPAPHVCLQ